MPKQFLHGHRDVKTTMLYTHVLNRGGKGVYSLLDRLLAARAASRCEDVRLRVSAA